MPIAFWLLIGLWRILKPRLTNIVPSLKLLISYGAQSYGIDLFNAVSNQVNQALVVSALSPVEMGLFAISTSFANMLSVFRLSIVTVLLPKMAAQSKKDIIEVTGRATRICGALTFIAGVSIVAIAPQLITFFIWF